MTKKFQEEQKRNKQLQRKLQSSSILDDSDDEQEWVDEEEYEEEDEVMSEICDSVVSVEAADPGSSDDDIDFSKVILSLVSPSSKKHAIKHAKLTATTPVKKRLAHKYWARQTVSSGKELLKESVEKFLNMDENSMILPNMPLGKTKNLRYRLESLQVLHEKFLAESSVECCYSLFTRYVLDNIRKPKA